MLGIGEPKDLLNALRNQTKDTPPDMVYVIDVLSVRFGGYFTPEIRSELQKYRNLQMLTLNDCAIVSLENFPYLPNLIRLDMVFNDIKGEDLVHLRSSRHIQTFMFGANKVETLEQVSQLSFFGNLMQLDLINNPVYRLPGYREKMFEVFPRLVVLDTLDKSGKDAFNNVTMMETVNRVPEHLFNRGPENVSFINNEQRNNFHRAFSRKGSLNDNNTFQTRTKLTGRRVSEIKQKKANTREKAGIVFPVARLKRMTKEKNISGMRVSRTSAIFMAATLQYLVAEVLELAGEEAKNHRKNRITPLILKDCLHNDSDISKLFKNVTLGTMAVL